MVRFAALRAVQPHLETPDFASEEKICLLLRDDVNVGCFAGNDFGDEFMG